MGTDSSKLQGEKEYETDPLSQRLSISGRYISESPGVLLPTYSQKGQYILLSSNRYAELGEHCLTIGTLFLVTYDNFQYYKDSYSLAKKYG